MFRKLVVLLIVLSILSLAAGSALAAPPPGKGHPRTIILSAFGFTTPSGYGGETGPFLTLLQDKEDVSAALPFCAYGYQGTLYQQPVVVVAMGVGKVNSTACMMNLLDQYKGRIKEVIWSGIAGMTPMFGGMVDAGGNLRNAKATVIGDVCASYILRDWDLQYSSVHEQRWWMSSDGTGAWWQTSSRAAVGDKALADELIAAGAQVAWPDVPSGPTANITKYHGADAVRKAQLFGPTNCIEVTGDNFWHGVAEDQRAREIAAKVVGDVVGGPASPDNMIIQTAMEGTGWANVLERHALATGEVIPWAYTRSASNFDHPWFLPGTTTPAVPGEESINAGMGSGGMSYASVTAALPVLKMLELRGK